MSWDGRGEEFTVCLFCFAVRGDRGKFGCIGV